MDEKKTCNLLKTCTLFPPNTSIFQAWKYLKAGKLEVNMKSFIWEKGKF